MIDRKEHDNRMRRIKITMKIKGQEISVDELTKELNLEKSFLKRRENGLLLNDHQVEVLNYYAIDYKNYSNLSSLLFGIDEYLNEATDYDTAELEEIYQELQEIHYYSETKK